MPGKDLCRKYSIGNSTFYKWRAKYGGMEVSEVHRLKELEEENRRLKQMYADLSLKSMLQEEIIKKAVVPVTMRKTKQRLPTRNPQPLIDRKSTRLNSSHVASSYAVFCLKKK